MIRSGLDILLISFLVTDLSAFTAVRGEFVVFNRVSGARYFPDLGNIQVKYENQCALVCSNSSTCVSASFDYEHQKCELGSMLVDPEEFVSAPGWALLYKIDLPRCKSGTCYEIIHDKMNWVKANEHCQTKYTGGHLAHIKSDSDMDLLISLTSTSYVWVGGRDVVKEDTFVWTDNTPVDDNHMWYNGQPDNSNNNEDCMMVYSADRNYTFNDFPCHISIKSVCQFPINSW